MLCNNSKNYFATATLACLLALVTAISIYIYQGDNDARIAAIYGDDSYIAHTLALENPADFVNDIGALTLADANAMTLLTALGRFFYRYLDINPKALFPFLVIAQGVLLALGMYFFTLVLTGKRALALLAGLFLLYSRLYAWNLAWYGYIQFYPYPGEFAMGFMLLTAALFLRRSFGWPVFFLLAGFTHSLQGAYLGCILALFVLYDTKLSEVYKDCRLWCVCVCGLLFLLPPILLTVQAFPTDPAYESFFVKILEQNTHIYTWRLAPQDFYPALFVYCLLLCFAFFCGRTLQNSQARRFLYAGITAGIVLPVIHIISANISVTFTEFIASMILTRSSQIVILLLFPFILYGVTQALLGQRKQVQFAFVLLFSAALVSPSPAYLAVSLLGYLALRYVDNSWLKSTIALALHIIPYVCLLHWGRLYFGVNWLFFIPMAAFLPVVFMTAAICALCFVFHWRAVSVAVVCITMSVGMFYSASKVYPQEELLAVQKWALQKTPKGTSFLLALPEYGFSWRSYSERPCVAVFQRLPISVYSFPKRAKPFILDEIAFLSKKMNIPAHEFTDLSYHELAAHIIPRMSRDDYVSFAQKYKCSYAISLQEKPLFDFPIVYGDDKYLIQKIY